MEIAPLNGKKTHPLSEVARSVLVGLQKKPLPCQEINPGVVNRLLRERLVEIVSLPSPYKTVDGSMQHLQITDEGTRAAKGHV